MTDHTPDDTPRDDSQLLAEIVVSRDRPAECTLFPTDSAEWDRTTAWLTATEGSFVSLTEMQ